MHERSLCLLMLAFAHAIYLVITLLHLMRTVITVKYRSHELSTMNCRVDVLIHNVRAFSNAMAVYDRLEKQVNGPSNKLSTTRLEDIKTLLNTLEKKVYITVTLTFTAKTALRTFTNINTKGQPLKLEDKLRAALVLETTDRGASTFLDTYGKMFCCI
jgi:hypothetical protein